MSSEAQDAVAFLQDLMVGKLVYDRMDPTHLRKLSAACQLVDHFALVDALLPEIGQKIAGLKASEKADAKEAELVGARKTLLGELGEAVAARIAALEERLVEIAADEKKRAEAVQDEAWVWGDKEAKPFDGVVAIDLGNTNVVCAHWNFQARDPDVSSTEPVAVNVTDAGTFHKLITGSYKVGEKALKNRNQINLYRSFRRWLGVDYKMRPAVTGSKMTPVDVADLVGAVIKDALQQLTKQVSPGGEPMRFPNVVVTVPASGDVAFEYELRQVFDRLRIRGSSELDEATAAGVYSLLRPLLRRDYASGPEPTTPGEWYAREYGMEFDGTVGEMHALCLDFGGGSTDVSLIRFGLVQDSRACRITVEVDAANGFEGLSGEGLTLYLFKLLKRRLALALADPQRAFVGSPSAETAKHPWEEFHSLEAGNAAMYVPQHLEEDLGKLLDNWDLIAGNAPLDATLTAAVDTMFPTISKDTARVGRRVRGMQFRFLWDEAERLKREISAERATQQGLVRGRLNPSGLRRQAKCVDIGAYLAAAGLNLTTMDVISVTSEDIDAFVDAKGERLFGAVKAMAEGKTIRRVLFAGNGSRDVQFAVKRRLSADLGFEPGQYELDPEQAKASVAKGACLWALGNRLEGVHVQILRRPRHSSTIKLVSAVRSDVLFTEGSLINRFSYTQPPEREGDDGSKLIQVDREVAGRLEPFMMFSPAKFGQLLPAISDQPIMQRNDLVVGNVDEFMEVTKTGDHMDFKVRDEAQYIQMAVEWVSNTEMLEMLRNEMTMEEAIGWIESSAALQEEPQQGHSFHRYYMDENRVLYLVYHARGKKLLVKGEVTESARRQLPEALDPFSGVH